MQQMEAVHRSFQREMGVAAQSHQMSFVWKAAIPIVELALQTLDGHQQI